MFITDSLFMIGHEHLVCQDYARSGTIELEDGRVRVPYAVISDGCSKSEDSDIGARVLTHIAATILPFTLFQDMTQDELRRIGPDELRRVGRIIAQEALHVQKPFQVKDSALFATLVIAYIYQDKYHVLMFGDGAWFMVDTDGVLHTTVVSYSDNAPYYPAYLLSKEAMAEFDGGMVEGVTRGVATIHRDTPPGITTDVKLTACHYFTGPADEVKMLAVASDGVESFFNAGEGDKLPTRNILRAFSAVKQPVGSFLKRRMLRVTSDFARGGVHHYDDLSAAAIIRNEV